MLMILRILFSVLAISLASYGLITNNHEYQAYMTLFLGLAMLIMGIQEIQQKRKKTGWFLIGVFAFMIFVAIKGFIYL